MGIWYKTDEILVAELCIQASCRFTEHSVASISITSYASLDGSDFPGNKPSLLQTSPPHPLSLRPVHGEEKRSIRPAEILQTKTFWLVLTLQCNLMRVLQQLEIQISFCIVLCYGMHE